MKKWKSSDKTDKIHPFEWYEYFDNKVTKIIYLSLYFQI